jgi:hypothetical protein
VYASVAPNVLADKCRVRIRVKQLPPGKENVEGFDVRAYEPDHIYDVDATLAEVLIVLNYAEPEMRRQSDRADDRPRRRIDRRAPR